MSQFPQTQYVQAAQAYGANPSAIPGVSPAGPANLIAVKPEVTDAYAVMWLRPGAPLSVVKAAYRALAPRHHPDGGGDPHAMRRLNDAYHILQTHLAP